MSMMTGIAPAYPRAVTSEPPSEITLPPVAAELVAAITETARWSEKNFRFFFAAI